MFVFGIRPTSRELTRFDLTAMLLPSSCEEPEHDDHHNDANRNEPDGQPA